MKLEKLMRVAEPGVDISDRPHQPDEPDRPDLPVESRLTKLPAAGSDAVGGTERGQAFKKAATATAATAKGSDAARAPEAMSAEATRQIESELKIDAVGDRCLICKKELAGDVFICPNCKNAKYHHDCFQMLVTSNEPRWVCKQHVITEHATKEVKSLQLRLNYVQKAIDDISAQFKQGTITEDTFVETCNQFLLPVPRR